MSYMVEEKKEKTDALETLLEFNGRILQNVPILIKELSGKRLDDTDVFLDDIVKAINWEIEVVNGTLDVINEGVVRLNKDAFNNKVLVLGEAVKSKDDSKMAEAFGDFLGVLEDLGKVVQEVIA